MVQQSGSLAISEERRGTVSIVRIQGKITFGPSVEQVRTRFAVLAQAGDNSFIFDLTQVPWMDSAGLGELVACHKRVMAAGGSFKLVLNKRLRNWIAQLRLPIEMYDSEEEALAGLEES
jgi:anti-anti-sigma factor